METKKIYIYLTEERKKKLLINYQTKYRVSLSTLAEKLFISYCKFYEEKYKDKRKELETDYLYKGIITSIKPRTSQYTELKNPQIIFTNLLSLLAEEKLDQIANKQKIKQYLISQLMKVKEDYYNLNSMIRCQARAKAKLKYMR